MKLLQITALTLCLQAPFSYSMQMGDNNQCGSQIAIASLAAVSAAIGCASACCDSQIIAKETRKVRALHDEERQLLERETHDDEADLPLGVRPYRNAGEIWHSEQTQTDIIRWNARESESCQCPLFCCCMALVFGRLALQSCSK